MNTNEVTTVISEIRPWKNEKGYFLVVDQGIYAVYGVPDVKPGDYVKLELGPEGCNVGGRQLVAHVRKSELQAALAACIPAQETTADVGRLQRDLNVAAMKECIEDAENVTSSHEGVFTLAAAFYAARAAKTLKTGGWP